MKLLLVVLFTLISPYSFAARFDVACEIALKNETVPLDAGTFEKDVFDRISTLDFIGVFFNGEEKALVEKILPGVKSKEAGTWPDSENNAPLYRIDLFLRMSLSGRVLEFSIVEFGTNDEESHTFAPRSDPPMVLVDVKRANVTIPGIMRTRIERGAKLRFIFGKQFLNLYYSFTSEEMYLTIQNSKDEKERKFLEFLTGNGGYW